MTRRPIFYLGFILTSQSSCTGIIITVACQRTGTRLTSDYELTEKVRQEIECKLNAI